MNAAARPERRGGGRSTLVLLGVTLGILGLLGGLPDFLGPVVAAFGVVLSALLRQYRPARETVWPLLPAFLALAALAVTAPIGVATELFAGLSSLTLLLWLADDPTRPAGGGRRAVPTLGPTALAVALVWGIGLVVSGRAEAVGVAGALIATGLIVLGLLVVAVSRHPPAEPTPAAAQGRRGEEPFPWEVDGR